MHPDELLEQWKNFKHPHGCISLYTKLSMVLLNLFIYFNSWMNDITGNVAHGSELAFVFNNQYPKVGTLLDPAKIFTASDQEMANIMGYYWTNMAKLKSPEGKEYPDWPQYNSILDQNLELNSASTRVNQGLYSINCDFWDIIYSNPSNVIH